MNTFVRRSLLWLSLLLALPAFAAQKVEDYSETINNFKKIDQVRPFFSSAHGYAVFPTIGKGGMFIGGAYGKGQVYRGGKVVGVTSVTDLSIGFQLGGQAYSQVIFFKDQRAFDAFTQGNFEFGAKAGAIAVTSSANAQTSTGGGTSAGAATSAEAGGKQARADYYKGMLVFVLGKGGLMFEATVAGQKYSFEALK
ncbi:YSC84-related protein [Aestuariirhabdus litorea]|uniref:Ysc84 actin-binding domain-containing protein n=1 Tax=Aestuariirhabdus litorea TaxID=2528527 RepID=A0A3P3VPH8_9GAMM|nr:lipid-binding SYLF domain-containing protein [Aestuariirhabdus litorea]RRJ83828.1 hypothetical protein D0544_01545 [Aestuariirhabdus litorea]RWW97051.1 hypothetical protein DZC74_01545 [Endozoicomonadaceae bacterium GTF-13]